MSDPWRGGVAVGVGRCCVITTDVGFSCVLAQTLVAADTFGPF